MTTAPLSGIARLSWSLVWPSGLACCLASHIHGCSFGKARMNYHGCKLTVVNVSRVDTGPCRQVGRGGEDTREHLAHLSAKSRCSPAVSPYNRILIKQERAHHKLDALPQQGHIGRLYNMKPWQEC